MRSLNSLGCLAGELENILLTPPDETLKIELAVESFCAAVVTELKRQNITEAQCNYLETHAYSINDMIKNNEIRNLHVLL
jgi:hypothetical protein